MRKGTCKHFRGSMVPCVKGVDLKKLTGGGPGWMCRLPCRSASLEKMSCEWYEEPTQADIEAEAVEVERLRERMRKIEPAIQALKRKHRGCTGSGSVECPAGCGGTLKYAISGNGHMHARCSTDGCLSFME